MTIAQVAQSGAAPWIIAATGFCVAVVLPIVNGLIKDRREREMEQQKTQLLRDIRDSNQRQADNQTATNIYLRERAIKDDERHNQNLAAMKTICKCGDCGNFTPKTKQP